MLDALVGEGASKATRDSFRQKLRSGELDDKKWSSRSRIPVHGPADIRYPGAPARRWA